MTRIFAAADVTVERGGAKRERNADADGHVVKGAEDASGGADDRKLKVFAMPLAGCGRFDIGCVSQKAKKKEEKKAKKEKKKVSAACECACVLCCVWLIDMQDKKKSKKSKKSEKDSE